MTPFLTVRGSARRSTPHRTRAIALMLALFLAGGSVPAPAAPPESLDLQEDTRPEYQLSLRDALGMAMDDNLDIAVQQFNVDISREGIGIAQGALESTLTSTYLEGETNQANADPFAGLPVITSKTRRFTSNWNDPTMWGGRFNIFFLGDKIRSNIFQLDPTFDAALNFRYSQSLLRNLGVDVNKAPISIAQNNERISHYQFVDTVQNTIELTEFAYWDLVFAREDLAVQRQSWELAVELLEMNRAKVEVGTMAPIDVTQAEAGVADRVEGVILAEATVMNAEDNLRQLLNPSTDSPIWTSQIVPTDEPSFDPMAPNMGAAIDSAMKNRPDLEQQELQVRSNALQENADRVQKRFDWTVQVDYNTQGLTGKGTVFDPVSGASITLDEDFADAVSELSDSQFHDWTLSTQLVIPLGNKDRRARYAQAKLRHQQSMIQLDNVKLAAEIDVRTRVRAVITNVKRVEAAIKNRELQQANVDAEQKKFENGMSTSFLVLQAQDALRSAERRENLAIVDYNKSLASLEKAKGTLLDARDIEVARATPGWAPHPSAMTTDLRGIIGQ